jgi:hypothetical protein
MINLEEYRFLDGWSQDKKKGSTRSDRIPTELISELEIDGRKGYQLLIPNSLESEFTVKDYKKASGLPMGQAQTALNILHYIGVVDRIGKKGNSILYKRQGETTDYDIPAAMEPEKPAGKRKRSSPKEKHSDITPEVETKAASEKSGTKAVPKTKRKTSTGKVKMKSS